MIFWPVKIKRFSISHFLLEGRRPIYDLKLPVKVQGQSQVHRKDLKVPSKNRKGRLSDKRIINYGPLM
jgi:hypothetical protein